MNNNNVINGKQEEIEKLNLAMRITLENAPIGFAVNTISDGKAIFINKKFEEIYGIEYKSIKTVGDFFEKVYLDPVFREEMRKRVSEDMASGDPSRMKWENIPITTKSGEKKFITAINIPMTEHNIMISTVQDVTKQNNDEQELQKSHDVLQNKIDELEKTNQLMVGRELTMIELKEKISELEKKLVEKKS